MSHILEVIGCLAAAASLSASFLTPNARVRAGGLLVAGTLALALRRLPRPLVLGLVLVICLYALQTIYSEDIPFAARNVGFFLIPFAILFSLLAEAPWDRRQLRLAFGVLIAESLILALFGIGQ